MIEQGLEARKASLGEIPSEGAFLEGLRRGKSTCLPCVKVSKSQSASPACHKYLRKVCHGSSRFCSMPYLTIATDEVAIRQQFAYFVLSRMG